MDRITSAKNPRVRQMRELKNAKERKKTGFFLVEGEVMVREAIKCGLELKDIAADDDHMAICEEFGGMVVSREVLESICETKTPQGICAVFTMPKVCAEADLPNRIVALDGVQDPGNVGTIWRTADAAGFECLLAGTGTADLMSPKVQRSSMGSGFRVPYALTGSLAETLKSLAEKGYHIVASDLKGEDFYGRPDLGERFVLIIGNEAKGISDAVRDCADVRVKLPMRGGAESLNAAVAAGIMMYEMMRTV